MAECYQIEKNVSELRQSFLPLQETALLFHQQGCATLLKLSCRGILLAKLTSVYAF